MALAWWKYAQKQDNFYTVALPVVFTNISNDQILFIKNNQKPVFNLKFSNKTDIDKIPKKIMINANVNISGNWFLYNHFEEIAAQFKPYATLLSMNNDTLGLNIYSSVGKTIPILPDTTLSLAPGYTYTNATEIIPKNIKIYGTTEALMQINSIKTVPVLLQNIKSPKNKKIELIMPKNEEIAYIDSSVRLKIQAERIVEKTITLNINTENGLIPMPRTCTVTYTAPLSKQLKDILETDIYAEVKITNTEKPLSITLRKLPNYIKIIDISPREISYYKGR